MSNVKGSCERLKEATKLVDSAVLSTLIGRSKGFIRNLIRIGEESGGVFSTKRTNLDEIKRITGIDVSLTPDEIKTWEKIDKTTLSKQKVLNLIVTHKK